MNEDKCLGALIGLAVGDAMGAPVEFSTRGTFEPVTGYRAGGPFNLPARYWTDDTSMALCLADSLIENRGVLNLRDQMNRYANWYLCGYNSSTGCCFDIGNGTLRSIESFLHTSKVPEYPVSSEGNGSLMRICPISIAYASLGETYIREASNLSSSLTHSFYASELSSEFAVLIHRALNGCGKENLHTPLVEVSETMANNSGYAPHSLSSALFHFHSTSSFEEAILQAANYGNDSDTVAAITGQLAGAFYDFSSIPQEWVEGLHEFSHLENIVKALINLNV